jgi:hypothetical protein
VPGRGPPPQHARRHGPTRNKEGRPSKARLTPVFDIYKGENKQTPTLSFSTSTTPPPPFHLPFLACDKAMACPPLPRGSRGAAAAPPLSLSSRTSTAGRRLRARSLPPQTTHLSPSPDLLATAPSRLPLQSGGPRPPSLHRSPLHSVSAAAPPPSRCLPPWLHLPGSAFARRGRQEDLRAMGLRKRRSSRGWPWGR